MGKSTCLFRADTTNTRENPCACPANSYHQVTAAQDTTTKRVNNSEPQYIHYCICNTGYKAKDNFWKANTCVKE